MSLGLSIGFLFDFLFIWLKEEPTSSPAANEIKARVTGLGRSLKKMILADLCSWDFKDTILETETRSFWSQDILAGCGCASWRDDSSSAI